jgi:hypothetical protein
MRKNDSIFEIKKSKIQNLNAKMISRKMDGQWISMDNAIARAFSCLFQCKKSATLCAIG